MNAAARKDFENVPGANRVGRNLISEGYRLVRTGVPMACASRRFFLVQLSSMRIAQVQFCGAEFFAFLRLTVLAHPSVWSQRRLVL